MPRYLNNSNETLYLKYDNKFLKPGEEKNTFSYYFDLEKSGAVSRTSNSPIISPISFNKIIKLDKNNKSYKLDFSQIGEDNNSFVLIRIIPISIVGDKYILVRLNDENYVEDTVTYKNSNIKIINEIIVLNGAVLELKNRNSVISEINVLITDKTNSAEILIVVENIFSKEFF